MSLARALETLGNDDIVQVRSAGHRIRVPQLFSFSRLSRFPREHHFNRSRTFISAVVCCVSELITSLLTDPGAKRSSKPARWVILSKKERNETGNDRVTRAVNRFQVVAFTSCRLLSNARILSPGRLRMAKATAAVFRWRHQSIIYRPWSQGPPTPTPPTPLSSSPALGPAVYVCFCQHLWRMLSESVGGRGMARGISH